MKRRPRVIVTHVILSAALLAAAVGARPAQAQEPPAEGADAVQKRSQRGLRIARMAESQGEDRPDPQTRDELLQRMMEARDAGLWERDAGIREQATDHFFKEHGWNSEPDQFARDLLRDVETVPPWDAQRRQQIFVDRVGQRLSLSEEQRRLLDQNAQREAMAIASRHLRTTMPIALEVLKTRSEGKPFTAEQVQRWSQTIEPIMEEARQAVERVSSKLSETMSPEQRRQLEIDLKALMRRHGDVVKMVDKWKQGRWTPNDWGLQNDAAHAGIVADIQRSEAHQMALLERKIAEEKDLRAKVNPRDEGEWERFVRLYCIKHGCNDRQITQAYGILRDVEKQARTYRQARGKEIAALAARIESTEDSSARAGLRKQQEQLLAPIAALFDQMCARLDAQVLTSDQRRAAQETAPAGAAAPRGGSTAPPAKPK